MDDGSREQQRMTAGLDLGDKYSYLCLLDTDSGEVIEEGRLLTTPEPKPSGDALTPSGRSRSPSRSAHTHPGRADCSKNAATKCWLPTLAR
jgi:hypothetical protein